MNRTRFLRLSFFLWIVVPIGLCLTVALGGSPHVIFSYDWSTPRHASYGDFEARHYTRCTFIGFYGVITEYPSNGKCDWLRFAKKPGGA
ncbi:MAG: hypothetical protein J0L77_02865 [Alphaproteobacteria bacterium]|nr:hypothetical protein [Alphaproteobacteria bacterium]